MGAFTEYELTLDDEYAILSTCIGWSIGKCKERRGELEDYISLFKDQIAQLDLVYGLGGERWPFADKRPLQLLDIVTKLRELGPTVTRDEATLAVKKHLKLLNIDDHTVHCLTDAALRTWALVNFRSRDDTSVGRGRPCVSWAGTETFAAKLEAVFPTSTTELTLSQRRLSPHFTAANMADICGLRIEWTSTLDDHLTLDRHHKVLHVFPCRSWLSVQAENARSHDPSSSKAPNGTNDGKDLGLQSQNTQRSFIPQAPLPRELYEEANRTLDLLFPSWDSQTQRYLRKRRKDFCATIHSNPRQLDLKHYPRWKDKLLELNEDVFLAPPEGWSQLWRDRRDPQKFWTFWIALLVLWLTIVTTVATIIQTWATLARS